MSRWLRCFLVVFAALAATPLACGGSSSGPRRAALVGPCTNEATRQAAIDANVFTPDDEITCRIRKVILIAGDLPKGWTASGRDHPESGGDKISRDEIGQCDVPYTYMAGGLGHTFEFGTELTPTVATNGPSTRRILGQALLVFDRGAASDVMSAYRRSCRFSDATPTVSDATGSEASPSIYHLISYPAVGDESILFRVDLTGSSAMYEMLTRRGDILSDVTLGGTGASANELLAIAKIADAKVATQSDYLQPTAVANVTPTPTIEPNSRQAILEGALPVIAELPPGWIPGRGNSEYDTSILRFCSNASVLPLRQRAASASYRSGMGANSAALGVGVMSFDPADADTVMRAASDGSAFPDGCGGRVRNTDVTWSVKRLDVPPLGDSSAAWQAIARHTAAAGPADTALTSDIELDFQLIRRGNLIALIVESRSAPAVGEPSFLDFDAKPDMTAIGAVVDENLKAIQGKVPPG